MVCLGLLGAVPIIALPAEALSVRAVLGAEPRLIATLAQADPPAPVMPNPILLAPGASPEEVVILQRQMQLLEVYAGPIDGDYNAATQEAVRAFQTANGLAATGLLDRDTWERMSTPQLLGDRSPTPDEAAVPDLLATVRSAEPAPAEPAPAEPAPAEPATPEAATPEAATPEAATPEPTDAENPEAPDAEISPGAEAGARRWLWLAVPGILALVSIVGLGIGWRSRRKRPNPEAAPPVPSLDDGPAAGVPTLESPHPQADSDPSPHPARSESPSATDGQALAPVNETTRLPSVNIVATLVEELASADPTLRHRAIWELGQRGDSTAIQPLVNGLLDADSQEKSLILAALSEISSRSLKPMHRALALALQDPSPEVRKNAIRDLSRVYDTLMQLGPMLNHATQDPDPEVQATAQWALGQLSRLAPAPYSDVRSLGSTPPSDRLPPSSPKS